MLKELHTGKDGLPPRLAFNGDTKLRKKKQRKIGPPRFLRETGKDMNSTRSLTEGCSKKNFHFSLRYILGPSSNLLWFRNGQFTKFKHERCNNKSV